METTKTYKCSFCGFLFSESPKCLEHEEGCNPKRACHSCRHYQGQAGTPFWCAVDSVDFEWDSSGFMLHCRFWHGR